MNHTVIKVVRKIVWGIFLAIVFIVLLDLLSRHTVDYPSDALLISDSSSVVPLSAREKQSQLLTTICLSQQISSAETSIAQQNARMQTRLSFIALLAVLFIPFLSSHDPKLQLGILSAVMFLFLGFYLFDVHSADYEYRQNYSKHWLENTIHQLSKKQIPDSSLYKVDEHRWAAWDSTLHADSGSRKIRQAFSPDLSQIAFYFLPFWVFLGLYLLVVNQSQAERTIPPNKSFPANNAGRKKHTS